MAKKSKRITLADVPEFAAATERMNELANRRHKLSQEIVEAEEEVRNAAAPGGLKEQAAAVLDGKEIADGSAIEGSRKRVSRLRNEERVFAEAVKLARDRVDKARKEASRKVIESARPVLEERIQAMADALVELNTAVGQYEEELDTIQRENPQISIAPFRHYGNSLVFNNTRLRNGRGSLLAAGTWLNEMKEKFAVSVKGAP